jgi:hypothetical protein
MKKYKYYSRSDRQKETIGVVKATSIGEAKTKARIKKQLDIYEFSKLFKVEEIDEREN